VVSHGGSGTFLAALAHGLPQVLVPQGADQFLNAAAAERAGVAIVLRGDQQDPDRIRQAVSIVLEDQGFAARAALVAEEIAAMPSADQVVDRLDDLLR
jgi:UDP:flavonoid glycosyltransferase YjiC (YdhE family)